MRLAKLNQQTLLVLFLTQLWSVAQVPFYHARFCSAPLLPALYVYIALLQLQVRIHFYFQNEPTDYLIKIVLHT